MACAALLGLGAGRSGADGTGPLRAGPPATGLGQSAGGAASAELTAEVAAAWLEDPARHAELVELLERGARAGAADSERRAAVTILRAVARQAVAGSAIGGSIVGIEPGAATEVRAELAAALGSVRTPGAAGALLAMAQRADARATEGGPAERAVRDAALAALRRLSGRADLSADLPAWRGWVERVRGMDQAQWGAELTRGLAGRADAQSGTIGGLVGRVAEMRRREFLNAAPDQRSGVLLEVLGDDLVSLRRLGLELVSRELANARSVDPAVIERVGAMINDASAEVRRGAAGVLAAAPSITADGIPARVRQRLSDETDAGVAAALLTAAARWPGPELLGPAARWAAVGEASGPAMMAAAEAVRNGGLPTPEQRRALLDAVRREQLAAAPAAGLALLLSVGEPSDAQAVRGLLAEHEPAVRLRAAEALLGAPRPMYAQWVLGAAGGDPTLFATALGAAVRLGLTPENWAQAMELPAPSFAARREALSALAAQIPDAARLPLATGTPEPWLRDAVLAPLAQRATAGVPDGADGLAPGALVEGVLLLMRTRMAVGQPASALLAGETLAWATDPPARRRIDDQLTLALLWLNRPEEAAKLGAPAEVWLVGLELSNAMPHAEELARRVRADFAGRLSQEQLDQLNSGWPEQPRTEPAAGLGATTDRERAGPPSPAKPPAVAPAPGQ
ncbi:MAG: hypothetical protein C0468_03235 [Planctomyces sp.]|nr:hypothetical protein [Planctomyces sp.]